MSDKPARQAVKISAAKAMLKRVLAAGLVPSITSSPGIGKSDLGRQIAKEDNLQFIDIRLAQSDPTDLNGFPSMNAERTRSTYLPPKDFPLVDDELPEGKDGWLILFDEMNSAPLSVQAAAYKVILDRQIGQHDLHPKVQMMAAGNLSTDRAIVNKLSTAMQSRMIHIQVMANLDDWVEWASIENIDHRIISYLQYKPKQLHNFDPSHSDLTFPCPRTWAFLSKLTSNKDISFNDLPLLGGTIGMGTATEFVGFIKIYKSLPSIEDIMQSPGTFQFESRADIHYALSGILSNAADDNNIDKLMLAIERLPKEFQVVCLKSACKRTPALANTPTITKWFSDNISLVG